ncbi:hypothetical protein KSP35_21015 [Aquihabitans sp. G128]|uniref:hypothetical protein n=1 Tax=Aquihabitans sp. G128 TaxID=2849779 RepID=UPI001C21A3F9|nr:hypothetical protein [Aquihabitans sp. G128]QXC60774.1 hypothetical protein KSP35_21015 [Aquihabitans sp. G128]
MAKYLQSGDANDQPRIEQSFAAKRAEILKAPDEAQAGLARSEASSAIDRCDASLAKQERDAQVAADRAEAERQAQEEADQRQAEQDEQDRLAEQEEADRIAAYAASCKEHGGHVDEQDECRVDYPGYEDQAVAILDDGSFDQATADANRSDCETASEDARLGSEEGVPWSQQPEYHADSGVCFYGNP